MTPLRRRMTEDLILRKLPPKTIRAYIGRLAEFVWYFNASPDGLCPEHVRIDVFNPLQGEVSWSVFNQSRVGLQFFCRINSGKHWVVAEVARPKAPNKLPIVLGTREMSPASGAGS